MTHKPEPGARERAAAPADAERLRQGLQRIGLDAGPEIHQRLLAFAGLVRKWSAAYNLVARGDLEALITRHVLDSLVIHSRTGPGPLLDVGSGAGFPGLALAIARPGMEVTLLDSSGKKTRFLRHAVRALDLANVRVVTGRVERYRPGTFFPAIASRAFGSLAELAGGVRHLACAETVILAMKGRRPDRELGELPGWVGVVAVERLEVPDLHAERHLVMMLVSPDLAAK